VKILLTGSEGFIGSHVKAKLLAKGHEVDTCDVLVPEVHGPYPPKDDITYPHMAGLIQPEDLCQYDVIIHLGAKVSVADSMEHPWDYIEYNSDDTQMLMEALQMCDKPRPKLVIASSSSVYGNVKIPFHEDGPTNPTNIYGLTKLVQEKTALLYSKVLDIDCVALRFFNCYGPGQAQHNPITGVMANFLRKFKDGEPVEVTEDGQQLRDFIHVDDLADAVVIAAEQHTIHPIYNICTGRATTMERAAHLLGGYVGHPWTVEITGKVRAGDQRHVVGQPDRFACEFDWKPRNVERGFLDYVDADMGVRSVIQS
jgi:dTDP-L-rhamnose 4-epimerase